MNKAPVNKIIDGSVVDGPGNRTVIFFQGCNFNCIYCHNPETINLCGDCGDCVKVCPTGALRRAGESVTRDAELCADCDACLGACPNCSSPKARCMSAEEALERIARNRAFIRGITCSGGECTLYRDFLVALFKGARSLGLGTLIDSNGSYDFSSDPELMSVSDGVMLDVKAADPAAHLFLTGAGNRGVMKNLVYLARTEKLTEIRVVAAEDDCFRSLDTVDKISRLTAPYAGSGRFELKIIAYRPFGVRREYGGIRPPSPKTLRKLRETAEANGLPKVSVV
jgi:pyruvate formate lyase activating enzyme